MKPPGKSGRRERTEKTPDGMRPAEEDMGKRIIGWLSFITGMAAVLLAAAYFLLAVYYRSGFSYGTWINGVYCTGRSVEEVNAELLKDCVYPGLTITDKAGNVSRISPEEIGLSFDFTPSLQAYLDRQKPFLWIENLFSSKERTLTPFVTFDPDRFEQVFEELPFLVDGIAEGRDVTIVKTSHGYELVNDRTGVLDVPRAEEAVRSALYGFSENLDLAGAGCYTDLPLDGQMKETCLLWEKVRDFQDCRIVYEFGEEKVPVDASVVCDWAKLDENGDFVLDENGDLTVDEDKIREYVARLAEEYDTVGKARQFKTTRGDTVMVEGGIYGNILDQKTEYAYLCRAFAEKADEVHTPAYLQMAKRPGRDDIGDTYIEIDMGRQTMYYYEKGQLQLETPVVTGNTSRRMGTPVGVNYVYGKQTNRILRGPGYASHVNFWMPVKGNVGIHDASWRSKYGGEIYQSGGSHGCINTPYEAMSKLYEEVEIGTPVVMFY